MSEPVLSLIVKHATDFDQETFKAFTPNASNRTTTEVAEQKPHIKRSHKSVSRLVTSNHQSQSFFLRYGSILPTSLTYTVPRPEASHLGDLMRLWVRLNPYWNKFHTLFKGPPNHQGHNKCCCALPNLGSLSLLEAIPRKHCWL